MLNSYVSHNLCLKEGGGIYWKISRRHLYFAYFVAKKLLNCGFKSKVSQTRDFYGGIALVKQKISPYNIVIQINVLKGVPVSALIIKAAVTCSLFIPFMTWV